MATAIIAPEKPRTTVASPPPPGATLASFALFFSLTALVGMVYAGAEWWNLGGRFGFAADAAWTRAVFARNLAAGHGLSFNPGVLVAGVPAPSWILVLAGVGHLLGHLLAAKALGLLCLALGAVLAWRITLDLLGDWRFAFLAGVLVAASPGLAVAALGGGEAAFAGLLVAGVVYWQALSWQGERRQRIALCLVAGLAALARPELVVLPGAMLVDRWLTASCHGQRGRRLRQALASSLPELLGVALVVAPYVFQSWHVGRELWQRPEAALRAQSPLAWPETALRAVWESNPVVACLAALGLPVAGLAAGRSGARHTSFLLVLVPAGLLAAPGFIWPEASSEAPRLCGTVLLPLAAVLAASGCFFLKRLLGGAPGPQAQGRRRALAAGIGLGVAGLAVSAWFAHWEMWQRYGFEVRQLHDLQVTMGQWAAERTAPDASIASREVGAIGYFSRRRMVDLGGTIEPGGLAYLRRRGAPDANLLAFLQQARPSNVAIRPGDFPDLAQRADLLTPALTCGARNPFTGGAVTWVLYETPWPAPSVRAATGDADNHD